MMDCYHHDERVEVVGVLEADHPTRITLEVRFDAATPTEAVLARVQHALDVHARPAALEGVRRAKAWLN